MQLRRCFWPEWILGVIVFRITGMSMAKKAGLKAKRKCTSEKANRANDAEQRLCVKWLGPEVRFIARIARGNKFKV